MPGREQDLVEKITAIDNNDKLAENLSDNARLTFLLQKTHIEQFYSYTVTCLAVCNGLWDERKIEIGSGIE